MQGCSLAFSFDAGSWTSCIESYDQPGPIVDGAEFLTAY
jgi:hypothetical protein